MKLLQGDVFEKIKLIESASVQCVVTSPPYYGLRNYKMDDQIGLEPNFRIYLENLKKLMVELHRVLKPDGTLFLNIGDTYSHDTHHGFSTQTLRKKLPKYQNAKDEPNIKQKDNNFHNKTRYGIPERFYINCIDAGWYARNHIIWHKTSHMPESVKDRFTTSYESIFFFTKNENYYFDLDAVRIPHGELDRDAKKLQAKEHTTPLFETKPVKRTWGHINGENIKKSNVPYHPKGKNPGDTWFFAGSGYKGNHFATYPIPLVERIIKCSTKPGDTILDPFMGSGTTAFVAQKLHRNWIGIELNPEYCKLINERVHLTGGIDQFGM